MIVRVIKGLATAGLLFGILIGADWLITSFLFELKGPKLPNSALIGQANHVFLVIQQVAEDQHGVYPRSAEAATRAWSEYGGPQEKERLPRSPWGGQQRALLPLCAHLGPAERPTPKGTVLGKGASVQDITDCRHFGALIYDADSSGKHCVLYAIGRAGDQAIVQVVLHDNEPSP